MNNFFTADTHYFHKNIIKYEDRPFNTVEEMNEIMIENHNKKVSKKDNVYFVGDFAFAQPEEVDSLLDRLNGNKFLIRGNHDKVVKHNSVRDKFGWIKDYYSLKINEYIIILFHYPIQVWDRKHYGSLHFYGHVHSNKEDHHPMLHELKNTYNVGVDVNNYKPISLEEILEKIRKS